MFFKIIFACYLNTTNTMQNILSTF